MPLVITSGYGENQLVPTSGYGSAVLVCGTEFRIDSVELPADNVIRARYTRPPKVSGGNPALRGDTLANYTIVDSKGTAVAIVQASGVSSDSDVIDLFLSEDISPGIYTLTVSSGVVTEGAPVFTLISPFVVNFQVARRLPT